MRPNTNTSLLPPTPFTELDTPGWTSTACGTKRLDNDVAAVADPYTGFDIYDIEEGGWLTLGGTSLSSPLVSSLYALAGGGGGVSGTVEGPDVTFKTLKVAAPAVETKAASAVGQTSATLNASVNPRGAPLSTCKFEYGTTTGYGSSVPCATLPGSGSSPVAVSASIGAGLTASTEYHYRISATNAAGTSKGEDVTFRTG
jgi:subtilase family serine protease